VHVRIGGDADMTQSLVLGQAPDQVEYSWNIGGYGGGHAEFAHSRSLRRSREDAAKSRFGRSPESP
jgi:hypothetical protein